MVILKGKTIIALVKYCSSKKAHFIMQVTYSDSVPSNKLFQDKAILVQNILIMGSKNQTPVAEWWLCGYQHLQLTSDHFIQSKKWLLALGKILHSLHIIETYTICTSSALEHVWIHQNNTMSGVLAEKFIAPWSLFVIFLHKKNLCLQGQRVTRSKCSGVGIHQA